VISEALADALAQTVTVTVTGGERREQTEGNKHNQKWRRRPVAMCKNDGVFMPGAWLQNVPLTSN